MPDGWSIRPELRLDTIRGLHLRRDVGERQSDIAVLDAEGGFMAMISSKWTWRSDRGTEAAQIIALRRYRPDIPYLLVTTEFPRAPSLVRESVEDLVFHTCPGWVGAWTILYGLPLGEARRQHPDLDDLCTRKVCVQQARSGWPYSILSNCRSSSGEAAVSAEAVAAAAGATPLPEPHQLGRDPAWW